MMNNPFDITKAVDFTDEEIYRYWVDIRERGFYDMMNPERLMPIMIVGSKGSGKTHIMKYFSYEVQKISKRLESGSKQDKYIGVYIRCSGFNADKFSGKGVSDEVWSCLYAYYWELWIGERITSIVIDLLKQETIKCIDEEDLVSSVMKLFTKNRKSLSSLEELREYFLSLQKNVDYEIQNFIFRGKNQPDVELLIPISKLSYEYPSILKEKIPFFGDKYILYLIDELENFSENQQKLIQTLLREKPVACTFRVGTRPYGIRTYKTLGVNEENHDGSEFHKLILDDFLRASPAGEYENYIAQICERRLRNASFPLPHDFELKNYIEEYGNEKTIESVFRKKDSQSRSCVGKLLRNLNSVKNRNLNETIVDEIIENIRFTEDPLVERANVVFMYRAIRDEYDDLLNFSKSIKDSAELYHKSKDQSTMHHIFLDKYRQDMYDAIAKEGRVGVPYYGFQKFVSLSSGNPRTMLRLLKAAFQAQYFETGKRPFDGNEKILTKFQKMAIEATYKWFFEENRIPSLTSNRPVDSVFRMGEYLQTLRFSDIPPQCSITIFAIPTESLSDKTRKTVELLEQYSYFVREVDRRKKNSMSKTRVYMFNPILIPKWELSLSKRGLVELSVEEAEIVFDSEKKLDFKKFLRRKFKQYNYPFTCHDAEEEVQDYLPL